MFVEFVDAINKITMRTRQTLSNNFITPFFSDKLKFIPPKKEEEPNRFFENGEKYELSGISCEDFIMPKKVYELVKTINSVDGVKMDSVVMKQIDGDKSTIFSLTKADCKKLDIPFSQGLQIFPKNMGWNKVNDKKLIEEKPSHIEFDSTNLSTYPVCYSDKLIHFIVIKLSGFNVLNSDTILTPDGHFVKIKDFFDTLTITTKRDIGNAHDFGNTFIQKYSHIKYKVVTSNVSRCNRFSNLVDASGCVFIELSFETLYDNMILGIHPSSFENLSFDDFFSVTYIHTNIKLSDDKPKKTIYHRYDDDWTSELLMNLQRNCLKATPKSNGYIYMFDKN